MGIEIRNPFSFVKEAKRTSPIFIKGAGGAMNLAEALGKSKTSTRSSLLPSEPGLVQHPCDFEAMEGAYTTVPIITGAIDKTVDFIVGPGFFVKSEDKKVQERINEWLREENFDDHLRTIIRNVLVFGIAPVEIIGKGEDLRLSILDPKSFYIKIDESGDIIGYVQVLSGKVVARWDTDEIAYFSYNNIGKNPYGTSMIRPLFGSGDEKVSLINNFLQMEKAMNTLIIRKANAPLHVKIGSPEEPASEGDVERMQNDLQLLRNENEFATSHLVDIDVVGFRGQIIDFKPFISHYENNIIFGLQVPVVLMGQANINEGLAKVQLESFERRAKSIQTSLEITIENGIFKKIVDDPPEFEWGSPTEDDIDQKLLRLVNILKTPGLTDDTRIDVEKEIRGVLGLEEKDIKLPEPPPMTQPAQRFGKPEDKEEDDEEESVGDIIGEFENMKRMKEEESKKNIELSETKRKLLQDLGDKLRRMG